MGHRVFILDDSCEFVVDNLHEAQAVHIVPKNQNGTDDPRNGLTLCRAHHWAFDTGLFTLAHDYTVVLSPLVRRADIRKFEMVSLEGQAAASTSTRSYSSSSHCHRVASGACVSGVTSPPALPPDKRAAPAASPEFLSGEGSGVLPRRSMH